MRMHLFSMLTLALSLPTQAMVSQNSINTSSSLYSIDTGHTISKVRSANNKAGSYIVASSYEGELLGVSYQGDILWHNKLSGYMNHDIWADDIDQDGIDEIFAANADGHVYCLSNTGKLLWTFKPNDVPMYSVTVLHNNNKNYVVAGGYDNSFYYLDNQGKLLKEVKSSSYSNAKPWYKKSKTHEKNGARIPPNKQHSVNFLRPLTQKDGNDLLALHATINSMQSAGTLYTFAPLTDKPLSEHPVKAGKTPMGDMHVVDINNDGYDEIVFGSTKMKGQNVMTLDSQSGQQKSIALGKIHKKFNAFGYRVTQTALINHQGKPSLFLLYGNDAAIIPADLSSSKGEVFTTKYAYNDLWQDPKTHQLILASAQTGGSAIHVINPNKKGWQQAFENLNPPGKLAEILSNSKKLNTEIKQFTADKTQRQPLPVYLMSDSRKTPKNVQNDISKNYTSPVFLSYGTLGSEKFDRSIIKNKTYRNKKDKRQKYNLSQAEILTKAKKLYQGYPGAAYWGGHGNDPYYRSLETHLKTLKLAKNKKTVMIFPEMAHYDADFVETLNAFMYPLAEASKQAKANIFLRNKHTFWQSHIYKAGWSRLLTGEFADVFIPAMEETTDKSMELSLAARSGLWASGVVNQWGTRFSRDNTSFDRLRQHSHQMVPNHALRQFVYHISNGSTYINNFAYDNEYLSVLWHLIGKGALYVPKINEILSYSPVNMGMLAPDGHYEDEGNNVKWTNMFDPKVEKDNKAVFSRLNGSWPGAPVTEWDFSRYAAGVNDRHLNYLPPYPSGLVLMTPPQHGKYADTTAVRGKLADHLHPIYKNIMTEFYTDGKKYYSADGKNTYPADQYYQTVAKTIQQKAKLLPITVTGDVSWVVAQTSPTNLRLTIIDGGYVNPKSATATVTFNTIKPTQVSDILTGDKFMPNNSVSTIKIPTGLFRFIDVTLAKPL